MYKESILIPVYNVEKYLSKCLESILLQTYKNIEIIIINDGTTDSSLDIANLYASSMISFMYIAMKMQVFLLLEIGH